MCLLPHRMCTCSCRTWPLTTTSCGSLLQTLAGIGDPPLPLLEYMGVLYSWAMTLCIYWVSIHSRFVACRHMWCAAVLPFVLLRHRSDFSNPCMWFLLHACQSVYIADLAGQASFTLWYSCHCCDVVEVYSKCAKNGDKPVLEWQCRPLLPVQKGYFHSFLQKLNSATMLYMAKMHVHIVAYVMSYTDTNLIQIYIYRYICMYVYIYIYI